MKLSTINEWLSLIANLGVIAGIIFLAFELQQNSRMMQAQTRNELARGVSDLLATWYANPEVVDAIVKSNRREELTDEERFIHVTRSEASFRYWENVHYQYRQGMYDEVEFSTHLETMRRVIAGNPSFVDYWCDSRGMYSPPFAAEIDNFVEETMC